MTRRSTTLCKFGQAAFAFRRFRRNLRRSFVGVERHVDGIWVCERVDLACKLGVWVVESHLFQPHSAILVSLFPGKGIEIEGEKINPP